MWDAAEGGDLAGNHGGHCPLLNLTAGGWSGARDVAHPLGSGRNAMKRMQLGMSIGVGCDPNGPGETRL